MVLGAPPIRACMQTVVPGCEGGVPCIWIICALKSPVDILQVTGSLLLQLLLWCLLVVWISSRRLTVNMLSIVHSAWCVQSSGRLNVECSAGDAVASRDTKKSRPRNGCSGVQFHCEIQPMWNAPTVNLKTSGVVVLDITQVPDVVGLRALYDDVETVWVLPSTADNSFHILVPDTRAGPKVCHDIVIQDLTCMTCPTVSSTDMSELRGLWPQSLLTDMTRRQADIDVMRQEFKRQFSSHCEWMCTHRGQTIVNNMAHHVAMFHLDLGQLWRCPVPWCSHWKGSLQTATTISGCATALGHQFKSPVWGSGSHLGQ